MPGRVTCGGALAEHVVAVGAARATGLFTVSERPEIGVRVARYGMPVRYDDTLLGYVWLTANEGPAGHREAGALRQAARQAALVLHHAQLREEAARSRERELVRDLVSTDPVFRPEAARTLIEEGLVTAGSVVAVVAAGAAENMAEALVRRLGAGLPSVPPRVFQAGVGQVRHRLADAAVSYEEARQAAEVARATGSGQAVTAYARLGVYALLAKLSSTDLVESMHPGLRDLLQPEAGVLELVETLSTYLDEAGDARRTVARLHIHRSTLYNRLHRIEKLTGLSPARGSDA